MADRYHLWHNLAEAVERTVLQHRALLPEHASAPAEPPTVMFPPQVTAPPRDTGRLSNRVREQHATVHALLGDGAALSVIARQLRLARNTVRRLACATNPDELLVGRWTGRASILDPYRPHIDQRFAAGLTNARRLFEEIQEHGYPGKEQIVRKYVHQLRQAFLRQDPPRRKPSVRDVTRWITRHPDRLDTDETQRLKEILARCLALATATEHVRAFAELMNTAKVGTSRTGSPLSRSTRSPP
ncbi:hypothetical protein [Actinacidiphila glaucinigra]|uniref:hypothetical protein n=1 Tax=Actinacidiphila glaucinigra TaxID=235986 RepID=UPI003D8A1C8C